MKPKHAPHQLRIVSEPSVGPAPLPLGLLFLLFLLEEDLLRVERREIWIGVAKLALQLPTIEKSCA